ERCIAEGLVYPQFVDNEDDYYITAEEVPKDTRPILIGQDFGGNKSKHTFCASAVSRDGRTLYVLASDEDKATGTRVEYISNALGSFIQRVEGIYNRRVANVYADSMEQAILNTEKGIYGSSFVQESIKNKVIDRIRCTDLLLSTKRIKIVKEHNKSLIAALRAATWDPKSAKDDRLDIPGTTNICPLDAFEYSFEYHIRDLTRKT
ncbi:MAG: PBSX family phage terminase large subunit, partial [Clostridia bacterium]|nr:PBSX family phage terminase large subunit [Clostridia bacterium]